MTKKIRHNFQTGEAAFSIKNVGRPKKEESEKRSVIIQLRVTENERDAIQSEASKNDQTVSDWIREKVMANVRVI